MTPRKLNVMKAFEASQEIEELEETIEAQAKELRRLRRIARKAEECFATLMDAFESDGADLRAEVEMLLELWERE